MNHHTGQMPNFPFLGLWECPSATPQKKITENEWGKRIGEERVQTFSWVCLATAQYLHTNHLFHKMFLHHYHWVFHPKNFQVAWDSCVNPIFLLLPFMDSTKKEKGNPSFLWKNWAAFRFELCQNLKVWQFDQKKIEPVMQYEMW